MWRTASAGGALRAEQALRDQPHPPRLGGRESPHAGHASAASGAAFGAGQSSSRLRDEGGDAERSLRVERDVAEEGVALERLDDARDAVVAAHAQVVALRDVVREHDARVLADAAGAP